MPSMAKMTKAQREWRPGMPKKRRSTKVMFASTVLLLEAFVAFFGTLAVFGLRRGEVDPGIILGVGIALSVVLVLACAVLSKPWGIAVGWGLQLVLILTGFAEPTMFIVGILFAICWWYGIRAGIRIDREVAQRDREQAEWNAAHGDQAGPQTP
ncbi:putative integral membrane protein [Paenarthrobacter aurescens TC1]|uniref:Integral membrane protein n=2 Tax=Micrococcales TaxID=85006 RepID=A1R794_PAEAT|nr:putative integral membrane protein [Paenarthrobacter aurescens TC1]